LAPVRGMLVLWLVVLIAGIVLFSVVGLSHN
jgi:hypothetical protein